MERRTLLQRAKRLNAVLEEFVAELDTARSADRQALRSLDINKNGATERAYSDKAFEIWGRKHRLYPKDLEAMHHLAVMHHARAIDLEHGQDAASSDTDWEAATQLWHELWQSDVFWESIANTVSKSSSTKIVEKLRQDFPVDYLQLHYDIATDDASPVSRRNYHVATALNSPFPDTAKERVRTVTYERYAVRIPETIWSTLTPNVTDVQSAEEIILEFLQVDPGCQPALGDALRIMVRFVRSRANDLTAAGDDLRKRHQILHDVCSVGERWRPYFEQLLEDNDALSEDMRMDLCLWGRVMGDVMQALERNEDAFDYYGIGERAGPVDDTQRVICRRNSIVLSTKIAFEKVQAEDADALRACESLLGRDDLIPEAYLNLGYAFYVLDDLETAMSICETGMNREPESIDYDLTEEDDKSIESLRSLQDSIRGQRAYKDAQEALGKRDFTRALKLFDEAVRYRPADPACVFFRSVVHIRRRNVEAAQADLDQYIAMSPDEASDTPSDHLKLVRGELENLRLDLDRLGEKAMELRDAALIAMNCEQYEEADAKVVAAVEAAAREDGAGVMAKLRSAVLSAWAVRDANQANVAIEVLEAARERLQQAVQLDRSNTHAVQNLKTIEAVIRPGNEPRICL